MSHKVYRLCLLSVVILAIVGGIFYYLHCVKDNEDITEGTLVQNGKEKGNTLSDEKKDMFSEEDMFCEEDELFCEDMEDDLAEATMVYQETQKALS